MLKVESETAKMMSLCFNDCNEKLEFQNFKTVIFKFIQEGGASYNTIGSDESKNTQPTSLKKLV